jgi:deoxyribodipyrimidine photo-lyase
MPISPSFAHLQVVWFKRDLRVEDHRPLVEAAARGPVVPLYVEEPSLVAAPDFDALHAGFIRASLVDLERELTQRGAPLLVLTGEVVDVLEALWRVTGFRALWSHQETGVALTFRRDRAVAAWCRTRGVTWTEYPAYGVVRGPVNRNGWQARWEAFMRTPLVAAPSHLPFAPLPMTGKPAAEVFQSLEINHAVASGIRRAADLRGGTREGHRWLADFLAGRGRGYQAAMSSPVTAYERCSRISPYLAWGCLSMKQVVQAARTKAAMVRAEGTTATGIRLADLRAFDARLHWHCHFIQKLESEPGIEEACFNPACEGVRQRGAFPERLVAWQQGRTGYPFVDACMRSLQTRGWINFRMRAMLVSFAAYDLWIDWRDLRDFLARHFIDYEPGIHISQLQMQSGVTGINTLRMYNPVKQGMDHDPDGSFIHAWVPELRELTGPMVHTPWKAASPPRDYPPPVVDHAGAVRSARAAFSALRRSDEHRAAARAVYEKHGSRKRPARRRKPPASASAAGQTELPWAE